MTGSTARPTSDERGGTQPPRCRRCGEEIWGSHYHCAHCKSTKTTSMMGHYEKLPGEDTWSFHCKEEDMYDDNEYLRFSEMLREAVYGLVENEIDDDAIRNEVDEALAEAGDE